MVERKRTRIYQSFRVAVMLARSESAGLWDMVYFEEQGLCSKNMLVLIRSRLHWKRNGTVCPRKSSEKRDAFFLRLQNVIKTKGDYIEM